MYVEKEIIWQYLRNKASPMTRGDNKPIDKTIDVPVIWFSVCEI